MSKFTLLVELSLTPQSITVGEWEFKDWDDPETTSKMSKCRF